MQLNIRSGPDAGKTIDVVGEQFTVGRDASCHLTITDFKVSRKHAYFKALPDGRAALHDLNSSNGTFVNGHRVESALLSGGEQVQFGDTVMAAVASPAAAPGTAPAAPGPVGGPGAAGAAAAGAAAAGHTPPTQPLPPAQTPSPQAPAPPQPPGPPRPPGPFTPPSPQPVGGSPQRSQSAIRRTQSAVQRAMLQRSVRRATIIGVAAIVLLVALGGLLVAGVIPPGDDDSEAQRPVRDIVKEVTPSTAFIQAFDSTGSGGTGTGWVYDADEGLVVTNAHVVTDLNTFGTQPNVTVSLGTEDDEREAEVISNALCADLAMLKVDDTDGMRTMPRVRRQSSLEEGDDVVAVGYPGTASEATNLVTTTGVISVVETSFDETGPNDPMSYPNVIQTSTPINPGNSGGPLVTRPSGDDQAELAGVNTLVRTSDPLSQRDIQGQNYSIGIDRVNELAPEMAEGENVCTEIQDEAVPQGIPSAPTPLPIPGEGELPGDEQIVP